jgi:PAS domain S-box-containing protein
MAEKPSQQRTVWVVDDSPLDAERARRTLSPEFTVELFNDGTSVLEHLNTHPAPDVLVLDWVMPGISGVDVCRFLRSSHRAWSNVAIVLLTGQNETAQIVEGLAAGANDYLPKPYAPEELRARVVARVRSNDLLERAERAEASVRVLLEHSPDPFFAVDHQHVVTYANIEGGRAFGLSPNELVGKPISSLIPGLREQSLDIRPGGPPRVLPDVTLGGRVFSPAVRQVPPDDAGTTMVTLRDVTERRQSDMRRLDFYSIMAHDLRGPLTAMLLRTDGLARGRRGVLSAEALNDVHRIETGVRSLVAMINDFLDLARLEGTGYKLDREEVDLPALVEGAVDELRPLVEASRISLSLDPAPTNVKVVGDRRRLVQVLSNLIGNAIKFTPAGGQIDMQVRASGQYVETAVCDTGRGIPKEALATLFDRFTRVEHKTHAIGGSGLGLMIVREIVEAHGGTVGVESEEGRGSRFWFRLPMTA